MSVRHQLVLARAIGITSMLAAGSALTQECGTSEARVESVEGTVELQRAGQSIWDVAVLGDRLCFGDSLRVKAYSRAALVLSEGTVLRIDEETVITLAVPEDDKRSWIDLLRGILHIVSRDPRALRITTPYANAGLEGTEFQLRVTDAETELIVFEGEVLFENSAGTVEVDDGQRSTAGENRIDTPIALARPRDASEWSVYFGPIIEGPLPEPGEPAPESAGPAFYSRRAASRLAIGRVPEAEGDIDRALYREPGNPDALALRSLLATTRSDYEAALSLADAALRSFPMSTAALIARSHAQERLFDVDGALATLERAAAIAPRSAITQGRYAELLMATGQIERALRAAEDAVNNDPGSSSAHSVLGYAALRLGQLDSAVNAFERALRLDPGAPLPRLGLGLAHIQQGRVADGRAEMELSVILDPSYSLSRSYVGKAYFEEDRERLADSQFEIAKLLDPYDPTPWFYSALQNQALNRPVDALNALRTSTSLNGDQTVFRSRLLLDEDLASRNVGIGQVYRELGFEQLALVAGRDSTSRNPGEFSGYRLLADMYSTQPRHQIARVSALFQSQMLQPINLTPIQPQLAESNLFILDTAGPSPLSFSEFSPSFTINDTSILLSGLAAENGTSGENVVVAGLHDNMSYSLGQFHFTTNGFRDNNDFEQDVLSAFLQYRVTPQSSVQTELRSSRTRHGDLRLLFDKDEFNPTLRQRDAVDSLRFGYRHSASHGGFLVSGIYQQADLSAMLAETSGVRVDGASHKVEMQHYANLERWRLRSGLSYLQQSGNETARVPLPFPPFTINNDSPIAVQHSAAYLYASADLSRTFTLTVGGSANYLDGQNGDFETFQPKLGLAWRITPRTVLRLAQFQTFTGPLISKQHILPGLEPTHVEGFNQVYFGVEGDEATQSSIGIDHTLTQRLFVGAEAIRRGLQTPTVHVVPPLPDPVVQFDSVDEELSRGYVYWAPKSDLAVSGELSREKFDNHGEVLSLGYSALETDSVLLRFRHFRDSGLSAGLTARHISQNGDFGSMDGSVFSGRDRFWVFDFALNFRLPRRMGNIELRIDNILDERFHFQDIDPENPRVMPERFGYLRFTLAL